MTQLEQEVERLRSLVASLKAANEERGEVIKALARMDDEPEMEVADIVDDVTWDLLQEQCLDAMYEHLYAMETRH